MKILLPILVLLLSTNINSQNNLKESVDLFTNNNVYFNEHHEELFFLHTNKTTFFSGEDIWFAAYVFDKQTEQPSILTKNLHLNLYDQNFKLVDQKIYFVNNGKTNGKLKLPKDTKTGSYYIVLDTNWNKNFKEGFVTKIEIVNLDSPYKHDITSKINYLVDEKDTTNFDKKNKEFLIIRNLKQYNSSVFNFRTTTKGTNKYKGQVLFAVLHKDGILSSCAPLVINHKKNYTIKFDSNLFLNGVNTVSLFDKEHHLIGNKHFWNSDSKIGNIKIDKKILKKDTLFLHLTASENIHKGRLSISVLAEENKFILTESNILKSFIDPNFNKIKENPKFLNNYLFHKNSYQNLEINKKITHKYETGIVLSGKLISKTKKSNDYKIALTSKENKIFLVTNLNKDNTFKFKNLYLKHPSKYSLALLNKNSKIQKSNFFMYDNYYDYVPKNILENQKSVLNEPDVNTTVLFGAKIYNKEKDVINLKEVVINSFIDKEKKIRKKYKNIRGAGFTEFYVPNDNLALGTDIFQYLQNVPGLRVYYSPLSNTPLIFNTRGQKSITGSQLVNIQLNGVSLGEDLDPLVGLLTTDFEIIMVNLSGAGEGLRGSNGVVNLIIKTSLEDKIKRQYSKIKYKETTNGFEISPPKFKKSNIVFDNVAQQKKYGTIYWLPNVNIASSKSTILKIPMLKEYYNIKIIINGFDENGTLIHHDFTISTD